MRFMVLVKASKESEAGIMPSQKLLADMGKFNEELVKAGVMLAGEGLQPSSKGVRIRFSGGTKTVIDGPFAETKELVAGFWLWKCKSKQEAIDWLSAPPSRIRRSRFDRSLSRRILAPSLRPSCVSKKTACVPGSRSTSSCTCTQWPHFNSCLTKRGIS